MWFYAAKLSQPNAEEAMEAHLIPDMMMGKGYQKTHPQKGKINHLDSLSTAPTPGV